MTINKGNYNFVENPRKMKCDKKIELRFENALQSGESKLFLENFAVNGIKSKQNCIDNATSFLSEFLVKAADLAGSSEKAIEDICRKKSSQPNWKFKKNKKT